MDLLTFSVDGEPPAWQWGSGGKPYNVKSWQNRIAWAAKRALMARELQGVWPLDRTYTVEITFNLRSKRKKDLGNMEKPAVDALQGILFEDDEQVDVLCLIKQRGASKPGADFEVGIILE